MIAKRIHVSGRVQGVFYRASTKQVAERLAIVGYAKNLPDGRVEVLAVGEAAQVEALVTWLWQGPPAAHVTAVDVVELVAEELPPLPARFATA